MFAEITTGTEYQFTVSTEYSVRLPAEVNNALALLASLASLCLSRFRSGCWCVRWMSESAATMSSAQSLRELISERLSAAAAEIFSEFEKTIVRYEEEIDRQRRLLELSWKPRTSSHTAGPSQQRDDEEEVLTADQLVCNQDRIFNLDQEEPETSQVKEEEEELCISQDEGQLILKQEADTFKVTVDYDESDQSEPNWNHFISVEARSQDQDKTRNKDVGSTGDEALKRRRKHQKEKIHVDVANAPLSGRQCDKTTGKKDIRCDVCNKRFSFKSAFKKHYRIHTGEKPYSCNICGNSFNQSYHLTAHMRGHTDEKPYPCQVCGKGFRRGESLLVHMRTHTGEKLYSCELCGKRFTQSGTLTVHMRTHTGEKPYPCELCDKRFRRGYSLFLHMRTHTGEGV